VIRWFESYPVVRGLGNLHGRFAFNASYYLFYGLFDVGPWWHRSEHLVGGLLLLVLAAQLATYLFKAVFDRRHLERHEIVGLLFIVPLSALLFIAVDNTSTDIPDFILGALVGIRLFRMVFHDRTRRELALDAILVIVLSAVGVSIKLSFVVFGGLASLLALFWLVRSRAAADEARQSPSVLWGIAAAGLLLAVWMIHGVMLSGYLAYPSSAIGFDVPWKVPGPLTDADARLVQAFARDPNGRTNAVLANWDWLRPWAARTLTRGIDVLLPIGVFVFGIVIWIGRERRRPSVMLPGLLLLLPSLASLVYWFFAAPDVRFAGATIWLPAAGALALSIRPQSDTRYVQAATVFAVVAALAGLIVTSNTFGHIGYPGPDHGLHPIPDAPIRTFVTDSGLTLYVPTASDQCWDALLPCTPFARAGLRLIDPNNIASGFMLSAP
jgi:hypothetical protein